MLEDKAREAGSKVEGSKAELETKKIHVAKAVTEDG